MIITNNGLPYLFKINFLNVFLVFMILLILFGILISWIVSRKLSYNFFINKLFVYKLYNFYSKISNLYILTYSIILLNW